MHFCRSFRSLRLGITSYATIITPPLGVFVQAHLFPITILTLQQPIRSRTMRGCWPVYVLFAPWFRRVTAAKKFSFVQFIFQFRNNIGTSCWQRLNASYYLVLQSLFSSKWPQKDGVSITNVASLSVLQHFLETSKQLSRRLLSRPVSGSAHSKCRQDYLQYHSMKVVLL